MNDITLVRKAIMGGLSCDNMGICFYFQSEIV